jgi:hypothetical protein
MLQILRQPGESWKIITKLDKFYRVKYFFYEIMIFCIFIFFKEFLNHVAWFLLWHIYLY